MKKKIVCLTWHSYNNLFLNHAADLAEWFDLKLYSVQLIDQGEQRVDDFFEDCACSDLVLLYPTRTDQYWNEVEKRVSEWKTSYLYLGGEGMTKIKNREDMETAVKCNSYLAHGGRGNIVNLFKYAAHAKAGAAAAYEEPEPMPWDGIFHPEADRYFQSIDEYFSWRPKNESGIIALMTSRYYWVNENIEPELELIKRIESKGYGVVPIFASDLKNDETGAPGQAAAVEKYLFDREGRPIPGCVVKFSSYFFETESGKEREKRSCSKDLLSRLDCPVIKPIVSSSMTVEDWRQDPYGTIGDLAWSVTIPEMEGVIEPMFIAGVEKSKGVERRKPINDRVDKVALRAIRWTKLKRKANKDRKLVFILNNNPCTGAEASVGGAANLDALESTAHILRRLQAEGYTIDNPPKDGEELIKTIMDRKAISEFRWTTVKEIIDKGGVLERIGKDTYLEWFNALPLKAQSEVIDAWGAPPGEEKDDVPPAMVYENTILITGVRYGNAIVCVQPKRGCAGPRCDGTVCKILHDPRVPPTHQYIASYKYYEYRFKADALIHVGTHGNLEFLPGRGTGLSENCYPDICSGHLPCLYIYNSDNPPEGTIAKRRALAAIVDHMQTTFTQSDVYGEIEELDTLLSQYDKTSAADKTHAHILEHQIKEAIEKAKMDRQIDLTSYHERFSEIIEEAHKQLSLIKNTRIQDGLHIFGHIPQGEEEIEFIGAIVRYQGEDDSLRSATVRLIGIDLQELFEKPGEVSRLYQKDNGTILFDIDRITKHILQVFFQLKYVDQTLDVLDYRIVDPAQLDVINSMRGRILDIRDRLQRSKEIDALISGLEGRFIPPGPSGIVTRGRDDVLPTGRNFFTLDSASIPTRAAYEVGRRLGEKIIGKYLSEENRYPENFSMYWMCNDITWADGEGMSQLLYLIGVRPRWLPNGRVAGFELIPLEELGRPRIDVTIKLSGILRDNFQDRVVMLDEAINAVAALNEDPEQNYVRKHSLQIMAEDPGISLERASERIFGAKPGTYISGVSLAVYALSWKDSKDFLDLFTYFNGYSYSKSNYGKESFKQLQNNLKTVDVAYNKVVSDEHDLLGCCCYFGNHGGMAAAARELSGKDVKTWYGDTREVTHVEVRTLADELHRVVRTRLLNPKWIEGQKRHGYTGAMNISKRIGRVYGWDATTNEVDDWIFDDITKTFISDEENRKFFMENNPWALEEISRRLIEAYERRLWQPEDGLIEDIRDNYLDIEAFMEESMGDNVGEFQGGSIDIVDLNELENYRNHVKGMREALSVGGK